MRCRLWQVAAMLVLCPAAFAAEPARGRYATQLAAECDALVQAAVRRPYGWGWDAVAPAGPAAHNAPRHVTLEPLGSPAAGLLLLWSGDLLDSGKYRQAAFEAARGAAATQLTNGKIPRRAIFAGTAGGRDEPAPIPERGSTRAALALMLALIEADPSKAEPIAGNAQRAMFWLVRQASNDGGWLSVYPPDASPRDAKRLIRLEMTDYRDSTYALILASQLAKEPLVTRAAGRNVEKLLALRLATRFDAPPPDNPRALAPADSQPIDHHLVHLWAGAYRADGSLDPTLDEFPIGADVVASTHAMQTLMAAYLAGGEKDVGIALDSAAQSLEALGGGKPLWQRTYAIGPTSKPSTQETGSTFTPPPPIPAVWASGSFNVQPTLNAVRQLKILGRETYIEMLSSQFSYRQHLAASICGLMESPLTLELPLTRAEVEPYLKRHEARFAILEGPIPQDLPSRLRRLWVLLIRARLERMEN